MRRTFGMSGWSRKREIWSRFLLSTGCHVFDYQPSGILMRSNSRYRVMMLRGKQEVLVPKPSLFSLPMSIAFLVDSSPMPFTSHFPVPSALPKMTLITTNKPATIFKYAHQASQKWKRFWDPVMALQYPSTHLPIVWLVHWHLP
ncbi:uncharacterized protein PADG_01353 [Paracoccidioides brasiliensis Pb18]|uniref:Uncharacterized protein n=1 Tax=Paracoccidioides brasiliensis (strain Pb18) TaxID=502780 RepID=C1G337_PARBD|nr:uncharacterized protein PADG_01353 [Paracoccidioides brasiliensis Pb18]EEH45203.2 hypothetical protein PADG_01353 [Paracoccidioides brasiliensis Pb18]